ncbi:MAG: FGGY-family carbohydrate kinase [Gammaproteobacteria bacterium]|nr:FGGY-family carbohydrate kinase [Gammaproteobacteria bacterium]
MPDYYIGLDIGTSGCRACAIDEHSELIAISHQPMPPAHIVDGQLQQDPIIWWQSVEKTLRQLLLQIEPEQVRAIAVDGTSGTLLITDDTGRPLAPALMYNDSSCSDQARRIADVAPVNSAAHGASSGLAKLMWLQQQHPQSRYILHQADWIAGKLMNHFGISDENNALKSGYDLVQSGWPEWLKQLDVDVQTLPTVVKPGTAIGQITPSIANDFKLPTDTQIIAGTTDSIAAFIAAGVSQPGEAVTSLGSSLVLKIISSKPVYSAEYGIYSHRLGDYWLAGGASNTGGAVLLDYFTPAQIKMLSEQIEPTLPTGLNYYPLTKPGERFPLNNPQLTSKLTPRPKNDVVFFQGMLEAMANIEHQGYQKLAELGAEYPISVATCGGGSRNDGWREIRHNILGVPVYTARHNEACYGSALLAKQAQ